MASTTTSGSTLNVPVTTPSGQQIFVSGTNDSIAASIATAVKGLSGNSTSTSSVPPASAASANTTQPTGAPSAANLPNQPTQPQTYTIASGDTLSTIAQKYGTNIQAIMSANPSIENPNKISAGSQLQIPGASPPQGAGALNAAANSIYGAVSSTPDVSNTGAVTAAAGAALNPAPAPTDPISAALAPIISQLTGYVNALTSPSQQNQSLQGEYNDLMDSSGLNGINTQMLNLQNVMNGTTDDIRSEITQANGFATESQVQAMSTARNNVILKQYNALATVQASLTSQVNAQLQFSEEDQQNYLSTINDASGITEAMASLQTQMTTNAQKQYDSIVTQVGYTGLASIVSGNPYQQGLAEESLGLPQGTLSDPDLVDQLQTMKQQQLAQGAQRIVIQDYNAGLGTGGAATSTSGASAPEVAATGTTGAAAGGQGGYTIQSGDTFAALAKANGTTVGAIEAANPGVSATHLQVGQQINLPGSSASSSAASGSAPTYTGAQMTTALANARASGQTTSVGADHSVVINGVTYAANGDGTYSPQEAAPAQSQAAKQTSPVDQEYQQLSSQAANAGQFSGSPLNTRRWSMAATAAVKPYTTLPIATTLAGSSQYLAKIEAAQKDPGSVSDVDLLDSYINLSKGSGQVTEAQISGITDGSSVADSADKLYNKLQNGGILSTNQRQALVALAQQVYSNYQELYKPVYNQAVSAMKQQGIPAAFWSMMPDLESLSSLGNLEAQESGTE